MVKQVVAEADGPCRDINFDPTILPRGVSVSDDPFPAARSAAYARSYDLRTSEAKDYPRTPAAAAECQAMNRTINHTRFSGAQRLLHWTMAAGIVAMLFIGVGMLSTIAPSYVPLVATHKTLGIALLALVLVRLALRVCWARRRCPPTCRH